MPAEAQRPLLARSPETHYEETSPVAGDALALAVAILVAAPVLRAGGETINYSDINKIKAEGLQRPQVMELCSWLSDVYTPRVTGSPTALKAAEWAVAKMKDWGLSNVGHRAVGATGTGSTAAGRTTSSTWR